MRLAPVDAVVCDLRMPRMDGGAFMDQARSQFPLVPVVVVTAVGCEDTAVEALQRGAADYVPKRLVPRDLVPRLERVLTMARRERSNLEVLRRIASRRTELVLDNNRAMIPAVVGHLQDLLDGFGLCSETDRIRVGVALEETLVNAVVHGNLEVGSELRGVDDDAFDALVQARTLTPPYRSRRVTCAASFDRNAARFVIRDEGQGFNVSALPDPTTAENIGRASGRGLLLVRTFMDEVAHNDRGNEVTLVKRRSNPRPAPQSAVASRPRREQLTLR
jgi:CheY-like chemotaxis protein